MGVTGPARGEASPRGRASWLALVIVFALFAAGPAAPALWVAPGASGSVASNDVASKIRMVEHGLCQAVSIKGQPAKTFELTARMAELNVPGVSVAVINNGRTEWAKAYGVLERGTESKVTPRTLFQAASISKPVAAMGILRLVEQGKLALDEDVNRRLKSWKVPDNEFTREQKVTLRRLLSHSAGMTVHGFRGYADGEQVPTLFEVLDGKKPANSAAIRVNVVPGSIWRYSGGGISVAQLLAMDATGKPFPEYMRATVLGPVGMSDSTYEQPLPSTLRSNVAVGHQTDGQVVKGKWHTYPEMAAAGLWTTPSDLCRFAIEIQRSKLGKSNKVLSPEMTSQMLMTQKDNWGLGVQVQGKGRGLRFSHGGANEGYRCQLIAYSDLGMGAAVMTNSDSGSQIAEEILRSIAVVYSWPDDQPQERTTISIDPSILKRYAGKYSAMGGTIEIIFDDGRLFVLAPPLGPVRVELFPETESKFFLLAGGADFTFIREPSGEVNELLIQPGGQTIKATRQK